MKLSDLKSYKVVGQEVPTKSEIEEFGAFQSQETKPSKGLFESMVKDPVESLLIKPAVRVAQVADVGVSGLTKGMKGVDEALARAEKDTNVLGFDVEGIGSGASGYKQVAGEALESAGNVASLALPGAGKLATTGLGKVGVSAATGAASGALAGAASGLQDDKTTSEIIKQSLITGTFGGLLGGAVGTAGALGSYATKKLPGTLVNTAVKTGLNENRLAIKYGGKTLGEELVDRGVRGTDKKLLDFSTKKVVNFENKLQEVLTKNKSKFITKEELLPYFNDLIETKGNTPGLSAQLKQIQSVIDELPDKMNVVKANQIKRNIYSALGDVAYKLDNNLTGARESQKILAKAIKEKIEEKVGGSIVKDLNKELSVFGRLQDNMVDKIARANKNNLLGLTDYLSGGAGLSFGAPGVAAVVGIKKGLGTTIAKTNIAVALDRVGKQIEKLPIDKAGKVSKNAVFNLLRNLSGS